MSAIKDADNVVEIKHGYFGWNVQPDQSDSKKGTAGQLICLLSDVERKQRNSKKYCIYGNDDAMMETQKL